MRGTDLEISVDLGKNIDGGKRMGFNCFACASGRTTLKACNPHSSLKYFGESKLSSNLNSVILPVLTGKYKTL